MDLTALQALLDWIGGHPLWSGLIVFLIAFSESLALVGLLVPGAILMFGLGTLITTGHLDFVTTCLWAIAGAVAGDGVSYWIGHHYRDTIKTIWPLSRHPQLVERGTRFFLRHGGKSILFGRFVGPVRPVIPAIAGMYGMPLIRFFSVNILSGIAWAPLYLIPGMVFGLSLTLAGEVAGRLVVIVLSLLLSILLLSWLFRQAYSLVLPHVDKVLFRLANWSYQHPVAGHIPAALVRPDHPEVRILSLLALLLFVTSALLITLGQFSTEQGLLIQFDKLLQHNLHLLQTPWMVQLMTWVGSWGSTRMIIIIAILTAVWLVKEQNPLAVWHLSAALTFPFMLKFGLPLLFSQPQDLAFPSATVILATTVYGFIAVTLAREVTQRAHLLIYLVTAILLFLIAFAQLYLQLDKLSSILTAFMLGCIWLALLGIAYRRHVQHAYVARGSLQFITVTYTVALIASALFVTPHQGPKQDVSRQTMSYAEWQTQGWQQLPLYRKDLRYKRQHPFNIQWSASLEEIKHQLQQMGWQVPLQASGAQMLQWLNPEAAAEKLPVLPHVHDGDYDVIRFVDYRQQIPIIIRLWPSHHVVTKAGVSKPLWVGSIASLRQEKIMGLTLWRTRHDFPQALQRFMQELLEVKATVGIQTGTTSSHQVILLNTF